MDRAALRGALRERREVVPAAAQAAGSAAIARALEGLGAWGQAREIAGFVGVRGEPDTRPILEAVLGSGKRLWLPRVSEGRRLAWVEVGDLDEELAPGAFGLLEPRPGQGGRAIERIMDIDLDVVLVPGLAFSRSGARIGFGCGYYDRALEAVAGEPRPLRIGVCFSTFLDPPEGPIPVASHDVPMHFVVTEHGIVTCRP